MAQITAASVKELRDRTLAGMADCKKALEETSGDMEKAADWLRWLIALYPVPLLHYIRHSRLFC